MPNILILYPFFLVISVILAFYKAHSIFFINVLRLDLKHINHFKTCIMMFPNWGPVNLRGRKMSKHSYY